jgi:hypothetical protein
MALTPLQHTEFWLKFFYVWPLAISVTSCKVKILHASSLQLSTSSETALTASHFKNPLQHKT